jgi:translation initiation factor IF-2
MQQRRPRLGDILDDYCPRERRITNHAVVAMIEEEIKQTRCATCDAEHEYKHGRIPVRRKKDGGVLAVATLAGASRPRAAAAEPLPAADEASPNEPVVPDAVVEEAPVELPLALDAAVDADPVVAEAEAEPVLAGDEDGPVHRRLIRATLPRPEGQPSEWKEPDFTIRQPGGGRGGFDGNRNGHRPGGGGGGAGRGGRKSGRPPGGPHAQARFGAPRNGGNNRHGSGQGQGPGGNRGGGRPGQHGQGAGQGQHRAQRQGGQGGRKRGR